MDFLFPVASVTNPIQRTGDNPATDGYKRPLGQKLVRTENQLLQFTLDYLRGHSFLKCQFAFGSLPHPSSVLRLWEIHSGVLRLESSESLSELTERIEGKRVRITAC